MESTDPSNYRSAPVGGRNLLLAPPTLLADFPLEPAVDP
jgi:hypothetical protein